MACVAVVCVSTSILCSACSRRLVKSSANALLSVNCRFSSSVFPSLSAGFGASGDFATPTDLATATDLIQETDLLPEDTRIWCLNYNRYPHVTVYAFASVEPLLIMKNNRAVLNRSAKDIMGIPLKISQKLKSASPVFDLIAVE